MIFLSILLATSVAGANLGKWSDTIKLPIVPVAGVVRPENGKLLLWSSGNPNREYFGLDGTYSQTYAAELNPNTFAVSSKLVSGGHSDMFCPGLSLGFDGQVVVTGGSSSRKTSIHTADAHDYQDAFKPGPDMNIARGYQASAIMSDGRIFTIGGSWSGGYGGKTGEVFDLRKNSWTSLPGCEVAPMETADREGEFRSDNHAWLFGWKDASIFQAGPSKDMNWYYAQGQGSHAPAGTRDDTDAMCGNAVMFDAVNGKIFTAGGAPWYNASVAVNNVNIITLSESSGSVQVTRAPPLQHARQFANSVVLPDGKILILGGQSSGHIFSDSDPVTIPELWDPSTMTTTALTDQITPRTYHSIALLLPDGRVFSGGGGLTIDWLLESASYNHHDGQIFTPPYLLNSDGQSLAPRVTIKSVSSNTVALGKSISVQMSDSSKVVQQFVMMRMGSATHTVDTDQRRVVVTVTKHIGTTYALKLPSDAGVMIPGYYYLFALHDGVPSTAQIMKVSIN